MKHIITYSIVFTASMALAGVGGFLLTPAKKAAQVQEATQPTSSENTAPVIEEDSEDEEEEETFIPKESTPVDYLIDDLLNMKCINISGDIDLSYTGYDISINNVNAYLTLETFTDIQAEVTADITYHGASTPVAVSYVGGTIYASLLGNDIKMETSDFADVMDILDSFGIQMETPAAFQNVSLDSIMNDMKSMSYDALTEGGYEFSVNLFGLDIYLTCDENYSLNYAEVNGTLEGIDLGVKLNTRLARTIETYVESPETEERVYQPFNSFLPFVKDIGRLAGETQFGIALSGSVTMSGKDAPLTIDGGLQFDINNKSGEGELTIVDKSDTTYVTDSSEVYPTHNIEINVDNENMKFRYNEGMYGKFTIQTLKDLIEVITEFIGGDNPVMLMLKDRIPQINEMGESTISHLISGEYELLFNDYITKLYADDTMLDIVISGRLLDMDGDIELIIGLNDGKITGITVPTTTLAGMTFEFSTQFTDYNPEYEKLPAESEAKYFDFSEIKFLLSIGLNTAEISYFHLTGKLNLPMELAGVFDLSDICKDITLELEIFNDMSDLSTRVIGKLSNIPSVVVVNKSSIWEDHKELDVCYDNESIYLQRHDIGSKLFSGAYDDTTSTKVSAEDMMKDNNLLKYLLGFGLGLTDTIMDTLMDAFTTSDPRTEPMDFSKLFNDYVYNVDTTITDFDGNTRTYERNWNMDINIGYLANNEDLQSLKVAIYGGDVFGLDGEYLQYISVDMAISAGGVFDCTVDLDAELIDIYPDIKPENFLKDTRTRDSYQKMLDYVSAHYNDQPTSFSY